MAHMCFFTELLGNQCHIFQIYEIGRTVVSERSEDIAINFRCMLLIWKLGREQDVVTDVPVVRGFDVTRFERKRCESCKAMLE